MIETRNNITADLNLLIEISCADFKNQHLFKEFHKMLLRMYYKADNVLIDYKMKTASMNISAEDESYDSESINEFADTMPVSLRYTEITSFLKSCIVSDPEILKYYYPFLRSSFFKRNSKTTDLTSLELIK